MWSLFGDKALLLNVISCHQIADILMQYINVVEESRAKYFSEMAEAIGKDAETWLNSLPHIHLF
jgi:hypothetical protein